MQKNYVFNYVVNYVVEIFPTTDYKLEIQQYKKPKLKYRSYKFGITL